MNPQDRTWIELKDQNGKPKTDKDGNSITKEVVLINGKEQPVESLGDSKCVIISDVPYYVPELNQGK